MSDQEELDESTHLLRENVCRSNEVSDSHTGGGVAGAAAGVARQGNIEDDVTDERAVSRRKDMAHDVIYGIGAFWETLKPVALTMILASLAVNYVNFDAGADSSGLEIYSAGPNASNSEQIEASILNAILVVSILAAITFVIVFLYWMGWTAVLWVYLVFAMTVLLFMLGGVLFFTLVQKFNLIIDYFTFFFILYNFAVVGVLSIFYSKGIPKYVTQSYLICISVSVVLATGCVSECMFFFMICSYFT